jgi:hypothetical protein
VDNANIAAPGDGKKRPAPEQPVGQQRGHATGERFPTFRTKQVIEALRLEARGSQQGDRKGSHNQSVVVTLRAAGSGAEGDER